MAILLLLGPVVAVTTFARSSANLLGEALPSSDTRSHRTLQGRDYVVSVESTHRLRDDVFELDMDPRINEIDCEGDTAIIIHAVGELRIPERAVLTGGVKWGCRNSAGELTPFQVRVVSVQADAPETLNDTRPSVLVVRCTPVSLEHVFDALDFRLKYHSLEQPDVGVRNESSTARRLSEQAQQSAEWDDWGEDWESVRGWGGRLRTRCSDCGITNRGIDLDVNFNIRWEWFQPRSIRIWDRTHELHDGFGRAARRCVLTVGPPLSIFPLNDSSRPCEMRSRRRFSYEIKASTRFDIRHYKDFKLALAHRHQKGWGGNLFVKGLPGLGVIRSILHYFGGSQVRCGGHRHVRRTTSHHRTCSCSRVARVPHPKP